MSNIYLFHTSGVSPNYWEKFVLVYPGDLAAAAAYVAAQVKADLRWRLDKAAKYQAQVLGSGAPGNDPILVCTQDGQWAVQVTGQATAPSHPDVMPVDDPLNGGSDTL